MDPRAAPDRLQRLPSWLLGQATVRARSATADALADDGMHRSQFALLATVEQFGPLSQKELSDRSGLDRSDVVRWIDDLAGRGLVERVQDPADRRRNVISLTRRGRRALDRLEQRLEDANERLLGALSPDQRAQLLVLLRMVVERD